MVRIVALALMVATFEAANGPARGESVQATNLVLRLDRVAPGLPELPIQIEAATNDAPSSAVIRNVSVYSPRFPLNKLLFIQALRLTFRLPDLAEGRMERVEIIGPQIFLGRDLFWYVSDLRRDLEGTGLSEEAGRPWEIGQLEIRGGEVVIATQGQPDFRLPLLFSAQQEDLKLPTLLHLPGALKVEIPRTSLEFPEYELTVAGLRGRLFFGVGGGTSGANNVVPVLAIDGVRWRRFEARQLWLTATFDAERITFCVGGGGYGGEVGAQFRLSYDRFRWEAWGWASHLEMGGLGTALLPGHVVAEGRADGAMTMRGRGRDVLRSEAELVFEKPGRIEFPAADRLSERLPDEWAPVQRELVQVALDAFRAYHFRTGAVAVVYAPPLSRMEAQFGGPEGERRVELRYHHHPDDEPNP